MPWYIGSPDPDSGPTLRFVSANLLLGEADPAAVCGLAAERLTSLPSRSSTLELCRTLSPALINEFPHSALRPRARGLPESACGVDT